MVIKDNGMGTGKYELDYDSPSDEGKSAGVSAPPMSIGGGAVLNRRRKRTIRKHK